MKLITLRDQRSWSVILIEILLAFRDLSRDDPGVVTSGDTTAQDMHVLSIKRSEKVVLDMLSWA